MWNLEVTRGDPLRTYLHLFTHWNFTRNRGWFQCLTSYCMMNIYVCGWTWTKTNLIKLLWSSDLILVYSLKEDTYFARKPTLFIYMVVNRYDDSKKTRPKVIYLYNIQFQSLTDWHIYVLHDHFNCIVVIHVAKHKKKNNQADVC